MARIFVNYRRDDERAFAARIRDRLAGEFGPTNVFMDVVNLVAGQRFDEELTAALAQTDIFIAVIGPRWMELFKARQATAERDFVHDEIAEALARKVVVIPALIEHAAVPRAADLPEDIREMVLHQKHSITHEQFDREIPGLIEAIKLARKREAEKRAAEPKPPSPARTTSTTIPWAWIGTSAAGTLAFAYVAAYNIGVPLPWPKVSDPPGLTPSTTVTAPTPALQEAKRKADEDARARAELERQRLAKIDDDAQANRLADLKAEEERRSKAGAIRKADEADRQEREVTRAKELIDALPLSDPSLIEISLPRNMFTAVPPQVVQNCLPGSNALVSARDDGKVRCVTNQAERTASTKQVRILWGPGYAEIELLLPLTAGSTIIDVPGQFLAANLRAAVPPPDSQPATPGMAAYKPASVRYFSGQQACGPTLSLTDSGFAPSIGDAGCKTLPSRAEVTFELDRNNSDRTIAFEAFKQTTTASLPLGDAKAATARLTPPDGRLNLPVAFNPERQQRYMSQYVGPAELLIKGARIFRNENCQQTGNSVVELFEKGTRKPDYQWPVWAQVYDNEGRSMTNCARSIVEKASPSGPYLTFEFVRTRPR